MEVQALPADGSESSFGLPVPRVEDARLLSGHGRYADDVAIPNMVFAYVVRSPHAHARIAGIDKTEALAAPGVLAVFTGEDVVQDKLGNLKCGTFPKRRSGP